MPTLRSRASAKPRVLLAARLTEQLQRIEMARRYKVGQAVSEYSRRMDPFSREWLVNVRLMVANGQLAAASESINYANAYSQTMGGRPADLNKAVTGVDKGYGKGSLGRTFERNQKLGRKIVDRDGAAAGKVWLERRAKRTASDLTWLAARDTLQAAVGLHPDMDGYRRIASPFACGACLALATGAVLPASEAFRDHPSCRCSIEPSVKGAPTIHRPNGAAHFKALSDGEQNSLLGPEKAALLREGDIDLPDLVSTPKGGIGRRKLITETPLYELPISASA